MKDDVISRDYPVYVIVCPYLKIVQTKMDLNYSVAKVVFVIFFTLAFESTCFKREKTKYFFQVFAKVSLQPI